MNPTLTVLVCIKSVDEYHDKLLVRALDSLRVQTYQDFEILIICDKCWAKTKGVIKDHQYDLNLKIVENTEGSGLYYAKNLGLSLITTDLVAYLDADDYIHPDKILTQLTFMVEHPEIDFCGVTGYQFQKDFEYENIFNDDQYETHEQIAERIPLENIIIHGSVMFKYSAVKALGGYRDVRYAEDWDLWFRSIQVGYKWYIIQKRMYYYSVGSSVPQ